MSWKNVDVETILSDSHNNENFIDSRGNQHIGLGDSPSIDPFGRLRVSNPFTIFDSKQISPNYNALFWDNQQVSGSGTTSVYDINRASTTLGLSANSTGKRVRQTFQRHNYQPGKGLQILSTFVMGDTPSGVTKEVGYFDDYNGIIFRNVGGKNYIVLRSYVTGSAVDTAIPQGEWNIDKLDGKGISGHTLDSKKAQILFADCEWLGVGRVRVGLVINGLFVPAHEFTHSNKITSVYMSTPNLPIRYSIEGSGTHSGTSLECICASVISEGGIEVNGIIRSVGTESSFINANTVGTKYALVGIRLKPNSFGHSIKPISVDILTATTNINFYWQLCLNPTISGSFTYSDLISSSVQSALGDLVGNPSTTTVSNSNIVLTGGYCSNSSKDVNINIEQKIRLGASIAGVADSLVLVVVPLNANADICGTINWIENV